MPRFFCVQKVYKIRKMWLREHADMLDGTPEQAYAGLMQCKRSIQRKTKRAVWAWKGWRVLGLGE